MDEKSTTDAADNQDVDAKANADANQSTDQDKATTDNQNADNSDNLDTSKSTDTSDDDDKKSTTGEKEDNSAPKFDTDLDEWAEKTKRAKPENDRDRAYLQEIRDGQREYSRNKQAKDSQTEVDKAIKDSKPADNKEDDEDDERDPVEKRQDDLEARLAESEALRARESYFNEKSVSPEESKTMGEILKEKVDKGGKAAFDYWTNPDQLEDWHALAKARLTSSTDNTAIEQEAARKERARIAKEHQAGGPSRNATTTESNDKSGYDRTKFLKSDD